MVIFTIEPERRTQLIGLNQQKLEIKQKKYGKFNHKSDDLINEKSRCDEEHHGIELIEPSKFINFCRFNQRTWQLVNFTNNNC